MVVKLLWRLKQWLEPVKPITQTQWAMRVRIVLRALGEADEEGRQPRVTAYKCRSWNAGGDTGTLTAQLRRLHEEGFFSTTGEVTTIVPFAELMVCSVCGLSEDDATDRRRERERFDPERQPLRAR